MDIPDRKNFQGANLQGVDLIEANFQGANLQGAKLEEANFEGVRNLSLYQLSRVKTLHAAKLDEELLIQLKKGILLFLNNFLNRKSSQRSPNALLKCSQCNQSSHILNVQQRI